MSSMEHVRLTYNMYLPICVSIDIQIATYILFQSQESCGFQVFAGLSLGTWDIWLLLWLWVVVVVWFTVSPTPWWGKNHWLDFASFKNKTHLGFPQTLDEFWDPEWFVTTFHKKGTLAKAVLKLCVVLLLVFWKVLTSIEATTFSYMFRI